MYRNSAAARVALTMIIFGAIALAANFARAQDATTAKPAAASSASSAGPVIVVIDTDRIRRECLAGKSVDAEAGKYSRGIEDENRKEESALHATELELQKLRATLPQDQFAEKARAFEQKVAEVQRGELKRRQAFDKSANTAMGKVQRVMIEAARDVASAHNADLVIQSQALLFYVTAWDVTNEVLELMNKRVTQVDFQPPAIEADQPAGGGAAQPAPGDQPKSSKSKDKDKSQQQQ
jgi:Skp family chaperone for outer membrane proteins